MLALIHRMRVRARDDLAEMFIRRGSTLHKRAKEELTAIQMHQRAMAEQLVAKLDDVLAILVEEKADPPADRRIRALLAPDGSLERLRDDCAAIRLSGGRNHLPLLWRFFASHRAALLRLPPTLDFVSAPQHQSLMDELAVVLAHEGRKAEWVSNSVDHRICPGSGAQLLI